VYNFALARVRLIGVTEAAQKVRVFFRMWQAQTTAITYTTPAAGAGPSPATGPFRQYWDGVDEGRKVPLLGLSSDGTEYRTIVQSRDSLVATENWCLRHEPASGRGCRKPDRERDIKRTIGANVRERWMPSCMTTSATSKRS
jgi:hypothetical protein